MILAGTLPLTVIMPSWGRIWTMTEALIPARHISLNATALNGARKTKSSPLMTPKMIILAFPLPSQAITLLRGRPMTMTEALLPARHISLNAAALNGARKTKSSPLMTPKVMRLAITLTLTAITPSWGRLMTMTEALIPARHISLNAAVLIGARKTKSSPLMPPKVMRLAGANTRALAFMAITPSWGRFRRLVKGGSKLVGRHISLKKAAPIGTRVLR